jgi:hypothetical protein
MNPAGAVLGCVAAVNRTTFLAPAQTTFASYWWWYASMQGAER